MSKKSIIVLLAMGMTFSVLADAHNKVQLWKDGPYWADTNIGAEKPWEYGYYFWWGDTVGYKRVNDAWVASDGSSSGFSFDAGNTLTYNKEISILLSEGWITSDTVLAPGHDAAHVQWGGEWRMPTCQELNDLKSKCDWTWAATNGVNGYIVRGRGDYSSASIFLPCAGGVRGTSFNGANSGGAYMSSVPASGYCGSWRLYFYSSDHGTINDVRFVGYSVRPVQGFAK